MHKICINGSRDYNDLTAITLVILERIPKGEEKDFTLILGGCRGPDSLARLVANNRGIKVIEVMAEWSKYGKSAGPKRNQIMIDQADELISFWNGTSRGTKGTIDMAKFKGIPITIHKVNK